MAKIKNEPSIEEMIQNSGPEIVKKSDNNILGLNDLQPPIEITEDNAADFAKNINPSKSDKNCGSCAAAILDNTNGGNSQALDQVPEHMRKQRSDGTLMEGYDPDKFVECFTHQGKDVSWSEKIKDNNGSRKKVANELEEALLNQGNGSKGFFYCEQIRGTNRGHYYFYTIINNKVHVIEGQSKYLQSTGGDYTNFYDDIAQAFDCTDGATGVYYVQVDSIKADRRKDLLKDRS